MVGKTNPSGGYRISQGGITVIRIRVCTYDVFSPPYELRESPLDLSLSPHEKVLLYVLCSHIPTYDTWSETLCLNLNM